MDDGGKVGRSFWVFAAALIYPCGGLFRQVGVVPLLLFALVALGALYLYMRFVVPQFSSEVWVGSVILLLAALTIALAKFPLFEHDHRLFGIPFGRADSNDAFVASWRALFRGHYPYYERSFLENPISPMPGALLWALPFYVLGATEFQNIFWLFIGWIALAKLCGSWRVASLAWVPLLLCPALVYSVLQGGDYTSNGIYVLLPAASMICCSKTRREWAYPAAVALGISLSSRANFLLLVPLFFGAIWKSDNFGAALKLLGTSAISCAAVTLPFYLYDPAGFSPLHTTHKLDLGGRFPYAAPVVFLLGLALATVLGWRMNEKPSLRTVCLRCFAVEGFVLLLGLALGSIGTRAWNLPYLSFGLLASVFGIYGATMPSAGIASAQK